MLNQVQKQNALDAVLPLAARPLCESEGGRGMSFLIKLIAAYYLTRPALKGNVVKLRKYDPDRVRRL